MEWRNTEMAEALLYVPSARVNQRILGWRRMAPGHSTLRAVDCARGSVGGLVWL